MRKLWLSALVLFAACGGEAAAPEISKDVLADMVVNPESLVGDFTLHADNCRFDPLPSFSIRHTSAWVIIATSDTGNIRSGDRFDDGEVEKSNGVWSIYSPSLDCLGWYLTFDAMLTSIREQTQIDVQPGQLFLLCKDTLSPDGFCDLTYNLSRTKTWRHLCIARLYASHTVGVDPCSRSWSKFKSSWR